MKSIGKHIWAHEDSMPLGGLKLRLRMTVVQYRDGSLWVHSPTKLSDELKSAVDELGRVAYIVGASNGHNLSLAQWQDAYPDAELHVSTGIPDRVQLKSPILLNSANENPWQGELTLATMPSTPMFNETVFLHHPSNSLIVTDLIQNHDASKPTGFGPRLAKSLFGLLGFKGKCVAPPLKMGFMRKDKAEFSAFIEEVNGWNFDKIIVTHGDIIDVDAKEVFATLCERFKV
jgi:hypothetical protein